MHPESGNFVLPRAPPKGDAPCGEVGEKPENVFFLVDELLFWF